MSQCFRWVQLGRNYCQTRRCTHFLQMGIRQTNRKTRIQFSKKKKFKKKNIFFFENKIGKLRKKLYPKSKDYNRSWLHFRVDRAGEIDSLGPGRK